MVLSSCGLLCCAALVSFVWTLEVSHQDLENPNGKICGQHGSCAFRNSSDLPLPDRNCMCDASCTKYGDCCLDSAHFHRAEQRRAVSQFQCEFVEGVGYIYRKDSCPPWWKDLNTRRLCEKSSMSDSSDPLLITPVTNTYSNITYGNIYCALCNADAAVSNHLLHWEQGLNCSRGNSVLPSRYDRYYVENNLEYNAAARSWQVRTENLTYTCELSSVMPEKAKPHLRGCISTVKTCPATWNREEIRERCETYTLIVYMYSAGNYDSNQPLSYKSYRNVHCAMCNNAPVHSLQCVADVVPKNAFESVPAFAILFDFSGGSSVGYVQPCGPGQLYDRFFRLCRDIVLEYNPADENEVNRNIGLEIENCSRIALQPSEFDIQDDSIYVARYGHTFHRGQFQLRNGVAEICSENFASQSVPKFRSYLSVLTTFGIGISIICLIAHLVVFAMVKELRNLSGKNLASMCLALLVAYCSFVASAWLEGKACFIGAIITYYFFLAAFTWMLVMAFDVWRTLRIATKELRVSSGKQWRKFFIYSFCSWILPAKIVLIAVLVDLCPVSFVAEQFKPHLGQGNCWFGRGPAILVFFGLPLLLILICNLSFFLSSAYMVYSSHSMAKYSASPNTKRDFKLYARLALIMGLTWIVGVIAGFADVELLWMLFVLLNTSLGLFIFIAFTCRSKVLHALKSLKRDSVLNLPAFNWSVNSSDDKMSNRGEKQTSSTYY